METQTEIDRQVVEVVKRQHEKAASILMENREKLDELAKYLYEKETITGESSWYPQRPASPPEGNRIKKEGTLCVPSFFGKITDLLHIQKDTRRSSRRFGCLFAACRSGGR